jgi:hypothetical protein
VQLLSKLTLLMGLFGKFIYSVMIVVNTLQPTWPINYVIYTATIPSAFTGAGEYNNANFGLKVHSTFSF